MSLDNALKFIAQQSGVKVQRPTGRINTSPTLVSNDQKMFAEANADALDEVAKYAVSVVKSKLSTSYWSNGPSAPWTPPHGRTWTLMNSIHWRRAKASREFPRPVARRFKRDFQQQYQWYNKIVRKAYDDNSIITPYPEPLQANDLVRVIEVNPQAVDLSDRQRLEYYSYYLETGWYNRPNMQFNDKGHVAHDMSVNSGEPSNELSRVMGSGWNPPRPYLQTLTLQVYKTTMELIYKRQLANKLPSHLRYMAWKASLTIQYNKALRVPYLSSNKGLLK